MICLASTHSTTYRISYESASHSTTRKGRDKQVEEKEEQVKQMSLIENIRSVDFFCTYEPIPVKAKIGFNISLAHEMSDALLMIKDKQGGIKFTDSIKENHVMMSFQGFEH